ncbi:MAG: hypothetical protein AAB467_03000 [Patescibacteria group bacterium]
MRRDRKKAEYYAQVPIYAGEDYTIFTLLADVRNFSNFVKPISELKGLPADISETTRKESRGRDDHSHSWLSLKELKRAQRRFIALKKYEHYYLKAIIALMKGLENKSCKPRLVFWFDN